MPKLRFTRSAIADLRNLALFLRSAGVDRATVNRIAHELREKCRSLANLPGKLGRGRPELGGDIRSFPFRGYVIFFRYREDLFEVVSVLDGRRDIEALFEQPSNDD